MFQCIPCLCLSKINTLNRKNFLRQFPISVWKQHWMSRISCENLMFQIYKMPCYMYGWPRAFFHMIKRKWWLHKYYSSLIIPLTIPKNFLWSILWITVFLFWYYLVYWIAKMYRIVHTVLIAQFIYHEIIYSTNGKGTSKYISYLIKLFDNF